MEKTYFVKIEAFIKPDVEVLVSIGTVEAPQVAEGESTLPFYYKQIDTDLVEFTAFNVEDYNKDYCIIVDEEGLMKSGNPAYKLTLSVDGVEYVRELVGNILIGKSEYGEEGAYETGLTKEEADNLISNLQVELFGFVQQIIQSGCHCWQPDYINKNSQITYLC